MTSTPSVQLRSALPADIDAMSAIRLAVTENVLSDPAKVTRQMYRDYMDALGHAWVGEADGQVVGFCYAVRADGSIWALFVHPHWEGRGIATRLLERACAWLGELGLPRATLSTTAGTRAERFYLAAGWDRATPDSDNQVRFTKELASPSP